MDDLTPCIKVYALLGGYAVQSIEWDDEDTAIEKWRVCSSISEVQRVVKQTLEAADRCLPATDGAESALKRQAGG